METDLDKSVEEIDDQIVMHTGVTPRKTMGRPKRWPLIRYGDPIPYEMYLHFRTQFFLDRWEGWRPASRLLRRNSLTKWEKFLGRRATTRDIVMDYLRFLSLTLTNGTIRREIGIISSVFNQMDSHRVIQDNPFRRLPIKADKKKAKDTCTEKQFEKWADLARNSNHESASMVLLSLNLMWYCGLSVADALRIKWSNVDMEKLTISGNRIKSGTPFMVPFISGGPLDLLLQRAVEDRPNTDSSTPNDLSKGDDNYLMPYFGWCQDSGNPPAAHKNIKTVCGGNVQTHSLRRAFCSRMVATGFNALAICRMTGHSSPDELSEYVTLDPEQLRQIVEAEHNQKFYDKNEIVFRPTPSA